MWVDVIGCVRLVWANGVRCLGVSGCELDGDLGEMLRAGAVFL